MKKIKILSILAIAIALQSCALIFSGTKDKVKIKSGTPTGAKVYYNGELIGTAPCTVKIPKKGIKSAVVRIEAPGYKPQEVRFHRKIKWGAVIGDCVGLVWFIGDFATGAIYKASPQKIHYDLVINDIPVANDFKVGETVIFSNENYKNAEGEVKIIYPNRIVLTHIKKSGKPIEIEVPLINVAKKK